MIKTQKEKNEVNHYRQKVKDHNYILDDTRDIFSHAWKWNEYFWNTHDIVLEIGTGLWNFFSSEVKKNANKNYIGKEIRYKRLYVTAEKTLEQWAHNFVLLQTKGENIDKTFSPWEIAETYVFFPDPWARKERQKKHRLFQKSFIQNLLEKTKLWGKLIFKTDHREYFDSTLELFWEFPNWKQVVCSHDYEQELAHFDKQNMTEFEHIFRETKTKICYIEFQKIEF